MPDALLIILIGILLVLAISWPFVRQRRRLLSRARRAAEEAARYGLDQPASLHPVVDLDVCSGCAACVAVCPEGDVLGLIGGQAAAIQPARCVGHGLCQRACPTQAIRLVFGTAERGVDLPRIQGNFETNVPGLFIVGELGGMGLVKNAFEQGKQCVEGIAKERNGQSNDIPDLAIIGCGPAGLAASLTAHRLGLDYVTLDKETDLGGTVRRYPRRKLVMTQPFEIPGWGKLGAQELPKEGLVGIWEEAAAQAGLQVRTGETVEAVSPRPEGGFEIQTNSGKTAAHRVILAIGRRGVPRKLGIPGEDGPNVYYSLAEPEHFAGRRVLVVGGGDSAVEAALMLADQEGTTVHLSYRREALSRVKPRNLERFEEAVANGVVTPLWQTTPTRIEEGEISYESPVGDRTIPADDVFIFVGGELPTAFLKACGVEMDTYFGESRNGNASS